MSAAPTAVRPASGAAQPQTRTVMDLIGRVVDAFLLGALWVVGSLPVVTVVAAGTGAEAVVAAWRQRRPAPVWSTFWEAYHATLGPAVRIGIVLLGALAVAAVDLLYVIATGMGPGSAVVLGIGTLLGGGALAVGAPIPALLRHAAVLPRRGRGPVVRPLLRDAMLVAARSPWCAITAVGLQVAAAITVVLAPPLLPLAVAMVAAVLHRLAGAGIRAAGG